MKKLRMRLVSVIASFMTLSSSYYINNISAVAMEPQVQAPGNKTFDWVKQNYKCQNTNNPATIKNVYEEHLLSEHETGQVILWLLANLGVLGTKWYGVKNGLLIDITTGQILTYDVILPGKLMGLPVVANKVNNDGSVSINYRNVNVDNMNANNLKLAGENWGVHSLKVDEILEGPTPENLINYKVVGGKLKNTVTGNYVNIIPKNGGNPKIFVFNENNVTADTAWAPTHPETFGIPVQAPPPPPAPPVEAPPTYTPPSGNGSGSDSPSSSSPIWPYFAFPLVVSAAIGGIVYGVKKYRGKKISNLAPPSIRGKETIKKEKTIVSGGTGKLANKSGDPKKDVKKTVMQKTKKTKTSGYYKDRAKTRI